jgi:cyclin D7
MQMEEVMSNSFLPATIQDMELTLLKALQWRLACVTPYSFLQLLLPLLTPHTTTTTTPSRCIRLLIRSLTGIINLAVSEYIILASLGVAL